MDRYILALDQGTGSSKAIIFDIEGRQLSCFQKETTLLFPRQGWVEQNAVKIWRSVRALLGEAVASVGDGEIAALGISNQRETTIVWDAVSGRPICNAIVWQDRRSSDYCDQLKAHGLEEMIREKTGLIIDAYSSATKIRWILDNVPGAMAKAKAGRLRFGTMDSWLVWNLTGGEVHVTDVTNASRTMLFNINTSVWDDELLNLFGIPESMLPEVCDSAGTVGEMTVLGRSIPISGIIGDQQSSLSDRCGGGRRQEHLRDRLLPAHELRKQARALGEPAAHHRGMENRRQGRLCARRQHSWPAPSCDGCATGSD